MIIKNLENYYENIFLLYDYKMKLSICCPTFGELKRTRNIIENIKNNIPWDDYEIIILSDWSKDKTDSWLKKNWKKLWIRWYTKANEWVTEAWNDLVMLAKWDYICVINNDIEFERRCLDRLIQPLKDSEEVFMTWPMTILWKNFIEWNAFHKKDLICGWCWMFRKKDLNKIFPIDSEIKIRYNDDWIYRKITEWLKKHYRPVREALVKHYGSQTIMNMNINKQVKQDQKEFKKIALKNWWNIRW